MREELERREKEFEERKAREKDEEEMKAKMLMIDERPTWDRDYSGSRLGIN